MSEYILKRYGRNMVAFIHDHHPIFPYKGLTSPFSKHDCIRAMSMTPCKVFEVESSSLWEKTLFPATFSWRGRLGKFYLKKVGKAFVPLQEQRFGMYQHECAYLFRAIRAAAVTVFPKAVVAANTPFVYGIKELMASSCSSRSLPLNATATGFAVIGFINHFISNSKRFQHSCYGILTTAGQGEVIIRKSLHGK